MLALLAKYILKWATSHHSVAFVWSRSPSLLAWRCSSFSLGSRPRSFPLHKPSPCGSQRGLNTPLSLSVLHWFLTALAIKSELHIAAPQICRVWPHLPLQPHLLPPSPCSPSHTELFLFLKYINLHPTSGPLHSLCPHDLMSLTSFSSFIFLLKG